MLSFFAMGEPETGAPTQGVTGAWGLYVVRSVELAFYLATSLFFLYAPAAGAAWGSGPLEHILLANNIAWVVLEAVGFALLLVFARGRTASAAQNVARAAVVLAGVSLVVSVIQLVADLGVSNLYWFSEPIFASATYAVFVAFEVCFWLALTRSAAGLSKAYAPIFFVMIAISAALSLSRILLPWATYRTLVTGALADLQPWVRIGSGCGRQLMPVLVLRRLARQVEAPATGAAKAAEPVQSASRDLVVGGLWLGGGLLVTLVSLSAASGAGGGHYVITTGAIAYGLVRFVRGLMRSGAK